jgi:uncharacterized protein (TIGR03067 family)
MRVLPLLTALAAGLLLSTGLLAVPDRPPKQKKTDPLTEEARKLQGTWEFVSMEYWGRRYDGPEFKVKFGNPRLIITQDKLTGTFFNQTSTTPLKIDPKANPKGIKLTGQQFVVARRVIQAIYKLEGDTLTTCFTMAGLKRPPEFSSTNDFIIIWKRAKP